MLRGGGGCVQLGDQIPIWFFCPVSWDFGSKVFELLFTLFHVSFHKDPKLTLHHCPILGLFCYQQKLTTYLCIAVKRTIARAWKKPIVSFSEVTSTLTTLMIHETMKNIVHDTHKVCATWLSYALPALHPPSLGVKYLIGD